VRIKYTVTETWEHAVTWLDDLAEFCETRYAQAGRSALQDEIARDMAVLEASLIRARNPLRRLLSEVAVKGFILSAEIGRHRPFRRRRGDHHALHFAGPGEAEPPIIELAALARIDSATPSDAPSAERAIARIRRQGIDASLKPAPRKGVCLALAWPSKALSAWAIPP